VKLITTIRDQEWRRSRKSGSGTRTWECQPDSEIPVDLLQQQMTTVLLCWPLLLLADSS
jgi:hypothetical protein